MNAFVPIALFGWIPVVVSLFTVLPPRRAILAAFLIAWLFLPEAAGLKVPLLPAYTKMTAATLGALLGVVLFDLRRLLGFRPHWVDMPLVLWCIARVGTSLSNGYGLYDGLSFAREVALMWGLPWLFGRLYFSDSEGMRELAMAVVIGGLVYVPLCLLEVRLSPQLHGWIYGYYQHDFAQTKRGEGWRPIVFMQHGLMVGMWMCMTGLVAWWLWMSRAVRTVWHLPISWAAVAILVTAVLCKSYGAVVLLVLGMAALYTARLLRSRAVLWCLVALAPLYMTARFSGIWSGASLVEWSQDLFGAQRAGSLETRINSENQFLRAASNRPLLGFRAWADTRAYWDASMKRAIPDALWMIELTENGLLGVAALAGFLLLPPSLLLWRTGRRELFTPALAPVLALAMVATLYMLDHLYNGMVNPVFALSTGAVAGWGLSAHRSRPLPLALPPATAIQPCARRALVP